MAPTSRNISVPLIRFSRGCGAEGCFWKIKREHDQGDSNSKLSVMEYTSSEVNLSTKFLQQMMFLIKQYVWLILVILFAEGVVTKTRNDPQRSTTIHNDPQRPTTIHNDPTTIHNDPTTIHNDLQTTEDDLKTTHNDPTSKKQKKPPKQKISKT